jgi:dTDP-4-amino-4,6-dideoxygalactose transaminase
MSTTEILVRKAFLPFALPDIDDTELAEVASIIRSGWLTSRS